MTLFPTPWHTRAQPLAEHGLYDPATEHDACGVGLVAAVDGAPRRDIVEMGIAALKCVYHRGAVDADGKTGDGAGIHLQIPQAFFADHLAQIGKSLRPGARLAVGMLFLPRKNLGAQETARAIVEQEVLRLGYRILGWRPVPVVAEIIGEVANDSRPEIEQVLIEAKPGTEEARVEREMFFIRKRIENTMRSRAIHEFYLCSLSCRSIVYKGLFKAEQLTAFYPDLLDARFASSYCIFHQRFSTNTAPAWHLAQPFRMLAHNGEINTLRGNVNFMKSHEATFACDNFTGFEADIVPVIPDNTSDTGALDAVVEVLTRAGRPLPLSKLILIPPAWSLSPDVPEHLKALFSFCNTVSEPWDGPAALAACDGEWIIAGMDRNGLRPMRYALTDDGILAAGSETGMVPVSDSRVIERGRLGPGELLGIHLGEGKLYRDHEIKTRLASTHPYAEWAKRIVPLADILHHASSPVQPLHAMEASRLHALHQAAGYTREEIDAILLPLAEAGKEAIGSMGDDTPLAVLSDQYRPFHHFFRQNFSQVTNPPIDPLRERRVMSLYTRFGNDGNYLAPDASHNETLLCETPVLLSHELAAIESHFAARITRLSTVFALAAPGNRLRQALDRLVREAEAATRAGTSYLLLTDEAIDEAHAPVPMILAVSAVHSHLVKCKLRKKASILVRTAECWEPHAAAVLIGAGATVVNPYVAEATIIQAWAQRPQALPLQGGGWGGGKTPSPCKGEGGVGVQSHPPEKEEGQGGGAETTDASPGSLKEQGNVASFRQTPSYQIERARELRKGMTEAETKLWRYLSHRQMEGAHFRRQHPVGPYICDFACTKKRLIIELDGGQHSTQSDYDQRRTEYLSAEGYRVLRFWNHEVMQNIEGVYQHIMHALSAPPPHPSPFQGEGASPPPSPPPFRGREFSPSRPEHINVWLGHFRDGLSGGLLKIMSKMGISVISSYRGGLNFEAIGLSRALVAEFFPGLPSRISGIGLEGIENRVLAQHARAFGAEECAKTALPIGGFYRWRARSEAHGWDGPLIHLLQRAVGEGSYRLYKHYSDGVRALPPIHLRDLLDFRTAHAPIPVDQVESVTDIRKRFVAPAMSLGALSKEAHETLAIAMNRMGAASNSGEGGEGAERYTPDANGNNANSTIKQVASARFGVTLEYLNSAHELQIKIAQGAKPGEGGQLPGFKVTDDIARLRHATPGVMLISPPPHHDIYSIEDLAQLIYDLKQANPHALVSVKLVAQAGIGTIASGVAKAMADKIVIAGHNGGTGASPWSGVKFAGIPWEMGLAEANQVLTLNRLRHRVKLQTDGGLKTGRDIVIAAMLGAEEFALGTASLVAMGCLMVRQCHSNTCPVGITTQDPALRAKFDGTVEKVINLFSFVAEEVREILASLGFSRLEEVVGRADLLAQVNRGSDDLVDLDLNALLTKADAGAHPRTFSLPGRNEVPDTLDAQMLHDARGALERGEKIQLAYTVKNTMRSIGTRLSSAQILRRTNVSTEALAKAEGELAGSLTKPNADPASAPSAPQDLVTLRLRGSAGQSLGAFLARGVRIELYGDANDYVGKGLSGGTIVVRPRPSSRITPHENTIVGNTVLYGATSGALFASGQAGERFAVRNSGATAVVEGCGSNGCEYMTGGTAVILGNTGHNFAAGMTGGMAFVYDPEGTFPTRVNDETVVVQPVQSQHWEAVLKALITTHLQETASPRAEAILAGWKYELPKFWHICPKEMISRLAEPLVDIANSAIRAS